MSDRPHIAFRPDIEGLRAIAVLLVVGYHAGVPFLPGGFVGVDVFFVLSGYLITRLLVAEVSSTGSIDLMRFYARRARRLLPAAVLVLVATIVASALVYAPITQIDIARTALWAAFYASNIHFALEASSYFGQNLQANPLVHMWSLSVEEQFYVVWPALLLGAVAVWRRRPGVAIAVVAGVVVIASFASSVWLTGVNQPWAFFSPLTRAWEFAIGALASFVVWRLPQTVALLLGWVGLAAILTSAAMVTSTTPWPGTAALALALGTVAVLIASASAPASGLAQLLGLRPMQHLGRLSYGWYLWHWPVLTLASEVMGGLSIPLALGLALVALGLAEVTYRLVENPVRQHARLTTRWSLAMVGVLTLTAGGAAAAWGAALQVPDSEAQSRLIAARTDAPQMELDGCILDVQDTEPRDCWYAATSGPVVALLGDSHAAQWFPAVEAVALSQGWRLWPHAKGGCPAVEVHVDRPDGSAYPQCAEWRDSLLARVAEERPAVVLLSARAGAHYGLSGDAWIAGTRATMDRLTAAGARVILIRDNPEPGYDMVDCLASAAWRRLAGAECTFNRDDVLRAAEWELHVPLPAGAAILDLTSSVCPEVRCTGVRDGLVVFRDGDHLTATFVASIADDLERALLLALD